MAFQLVAEYSIKMGKLRAHIILSLFDIATLFVLYHLFSEWNRISDSILLSENNIRIQKPLGLYLLLLVIPLIHLTSLINVPKTYNRLANYALSGVFLLIIVFSFYLDVRIESRLINAGYSYCKNKSENMRFSEFKVFLKDRNQCIE